MSKLKVSGNASGTGVITLEAPNTNTDRTITLPDATTTLGVPSGIISMWSGLVGAIPSGWVICDGTNSTPNLTGKFIKAATTAGGTGGSATTGAHTLSTSEMPSHSHTLNQYVTGDTNHTGGGNRNLLLGGTWTTSSTGGGGSHTHTSEPEYFALIYIMKS